MNSITVQTKARTHFIDITDEVQRFAQEKDLTNGLITVFVPHTTAGITINENADPDVTADMDGVLNDLIPWSNGYLHAEGNTAAHAKASLMGSFIIRNSDFFGYLGISTLGIKYCVNRINLKKMRSER